MKEAETIIKVCDLDFTMQFGPHRCSLQETQIIDCDKPVDWDAFLPHQSLKPKLCRPKEEGSNYAKFL